jgi:hypothetical protein
MSKRFICSSSPVSSLKFPSHIRVDSHQKEVGKDILDAMAQLGNRQGVIIQNTHESIPGAVGKRPVFHRFESQPLGFRKLRILVAHIFLVHPSKVRILHACAKYTYMDKGGIVNLFLAHT